MKKILFVINNLNVGGVPKSLIELLRCIYDKYEISLFCVSGEGPMTEDVPENVTILSASKLLQVSEFSLSACKRMGFFYYLLRMMFSFLSKRFGKKFPAKLLLKMVGKLPGEYDVAISFVQPVQDKDFYNLCNEFVLQNVRAKRKISFVHCDFLSYGGNTKYNRNLYVKFDAVAAVSDSVGKRFLEANPKLSGKVFTVYNCCGTDAVQQLANINPVVYDKTTFVTVARLSPEKGLLRCVDIFRKLKDEGYDFEWHIVGGGNLEKQLHDIITVADMQDCIFLEGEQQNPYRYMKNADYFLLSSFHEAAPMVFGEAACLGLPILTTKTLSAKELVEERGIGKACDNSEEGIYEIVKTALDKKLTFDLNQFTTLNEKAISQFKFICEGVTQVNA